MGTGVPTRSAVAGMRVRGVPDGLISDVARDLVSKPAVVVIAENYTSFSAVPAEIAALTGRSYVIDVAVSRYSFRNQDICFQVLKFYPEGSAVFVGLDAALLAAGKPAGSLVRSVGSSVEQGSGSGSADKGDQVLM